MRAVVQRVNEASVVVDGTITGEIESGILLLLGIEVEDSEEDFQYIFRKVLNLRIFDDENGVMNKSLLDVDGELLVVSQFTLYGDAKKGNRPSYIRAAKHEKSTYFYEKFIEDAKKEVKKVESGVFGADMKVHLVNNGPVTILLDSRKEF